MEQTDINQGSQDGQLYSQPENGVKTMPVIQEQIQVSNETIETGKVHFFKKVSEEEYNQNLPLVKEEVIVEKKAVNQYVDDAIPGIRLDGDTTIIPVLREVMVKRVLLVEEIHITKRKTETTVTAHETLRKEEVIITRSSASSGG